MAAAQARAGFPDEALRTLADGDHGGFAAGEIALALASSGRREDALAAVRRLDTPDAQTRAFVRLAVATRSAEWLQHAAAMVAGIEGDPEQNDLWSGIAIAYARLSQRDNALRAARMIGIRHRRAEALADIAAATHDADLLDEARSHVMGFDGARDEVWAALARAEVALGELQEARRTLSAQLPGTPSRALAAAVGQLAAVYWLKGEQPGARKLIDDLLGGSWTIGEARTVLARHLMAVGRLDDARQISFLVDEITFDNLSAEIALKQAESGVFADALATAESIQYPGRRSSTLAEISTLLPR